MRRWSVLVTFTLVFAMSISAVAQQMSREDIRDRVRASLQKIGARADVGVDFQQSEKQPFNFFGFMRTGLKNAKALEIVVGISQDQTISVRAFPQIGDGYINVDRVTNSSGLMHKLLNFNQHNFMYWGADDSGDVFSGFTFTLESGYPEEALTVVIRSLRNLDQYIGQMRPMIDGSQPVQ